MLCAPISYKSFKEDCIISAIPNPNQYKLMYEAGKVAIHSISIDFFALVVFVIEKKMYCAHVRLNGLLQLAL